MSDRKYFVDLPMLDRFTAFHRKWIKTYAHMLDAISDAYQTLLDRVVHDMRLPLEAGELRKLIAILQECDPLLTHVTDDSRRSIEAAEAKVDEIAAIFTGDDPYVAYSQEYQAVSDFLTGLRSGIEGESICYRNVDMGNDHELVLCAVSYTAFDWCELREKYRNTTQSATEVFEKEISCDLPSVNRLYALLAAEYAKAREILLAQPETPQ